MTKHTQTTGRQQLTNCLNEFDHLVGLALQGLSMNFECHPMNFVFFTEMIRVLIF